jgi:hypothetical protein
MSLAESYSPGELIHARGREWIVLSSGDSLRIRPLTGSEHEIETIVPELEATPVRYAAFDPPDISRYGGREARFAVPVASTLNLAPTS